MRSCDSILFVKVHTVPNSLTFNVYRTLVFPLKAARQNIWGWF